MDPEKNRYDFARPPLMSVENMTLLVIFLVNAEGYTEKRMLVATP